MMYIPDKWMFVRIMGTDPHWRILGTWCGGFVTGTSWRLNSGIFQAEEQEEYFDFISHNGSLYRCYKDSYGAFTYGSGALRDLVRRSEGTMEAIWDEPKNISEFVKGMLDKSSSSLYNDYC